MTSLAALAAHLVTMSVHAIAPPGSLGATTPEISLDADRCLSVRRDEVLRLAALELDARVVDPAHAGAGTTRVTVVCAGPEVQLAVADPITGKQLMRTIALTAREVDVAARMVALAVSELVITSWMELTLTSPSATPGAGSADLELRRAAQERARRHAPTRAGAAYLLAVGQATGPFSGIGVGWGGGLRIGRLFSARWIERGEVIGSPAAELDFAGSWTDVNGALGSVHVAMWSAAPRLSFRLRRGPTFMDIGAGGRFGLARLSGVPSDPTQVRGGTLAGTWAGPIVTAGVGIQISHLVLAAGVEVGTVLRTVAGLVDGSSAVSISGRWVSGVVAVGWGE